MEKVRINTSRAYDVLIDSGLLDKAGELIAPLAVSKRACVITDDNVDRIYGERIVF